MPGRVRQRFLQDPVGRLVDCRRKLPLLGKTPELLVQLNVTNLTDEDEVMPLRYNATHTGYARVLVFEPRNFRLTVGLKF